MTPILVLYYHLSLPQVGYGSVSCQPLPSTYRTERPWWKIPDASGRHATWSGGMGVSGWDREGAPLSSTRYKFDPMLIEVVASPLRVLLSRCRG